MPQASTCSTMGLESQHGNPQDPRIPGFSLAELLWNKRFWLADWWLMLSLIGSLPSSSMRSFSALWPPLWSWPAADVVIWSGCHIRGRASERKKMWENWESFLLRGSSRLKLLSDQVNWFSQNMKFGKDTMTKNLKCWKQSEGVVKWKNISFIFVLLWESPTSYQNNYPCEKTTWPFVKVDQFV